MPNLIDRARWRPQNLLANVALKGAKLTWTLRSGLSVAVTSSADWVIYNEIFVNGEYDPAIQLLETPDPGAHRVIVDLGANVGFFSLRVADFLLERNAQANFSLFMVEGSPSTGAILQARIAAQPGLAGKTRVVCGLVGKKTGSGSLYEFGYHAMTGVLPRKLSRRVDVPFVDLSALLQDVPRIDLLKCDIEGSEEQFLETYSDVLRKTTAVVIELHTQQCDVAACRRHLVEAGFHQRLSIRSEGATETALFVKE